MQRLAFGFARALHDVASVVWTGGLITLGLVVVPSARTALGKSPQTRAVLDAIQKRLTTIVYPSMLVVVVTGLLEARHSPAFRGLFSFANTYSAILATKHILVALMLAIGLYRSLMLVRRQVPPASDRLKMSLLYANMFLAVCVLILSGVNTAAGH